LVSVKGIVAWETSTSRSETAGVRLAKHYFRKAADLHHVITIDNLACEARNGYFWFDDSVVQEDQGREPDLEEAFRLFQEGARLGHSISCRNLGPSYLNGSGTEKNEAKGFKWTKRAAESGQDAAVMYECGNCYLQGTGVEQSNEQAMYWFEKSLEVEEHAAVRSALETLRRRQQL
jgi:Sel1 repeat